LIFSPNVFNNFHIALYTNVISKYLWQDLNVQGRGEAERILEAVIQREVQAVRGVLKTFIRVGKILEEIPAATAETGEILR